MRLRSVLGVVLSVTSCVALVLAEDRSDGAPATGAVVERLSFESSGEAFLVYVKTSVPVPRFVCNLPGAGSRDATVELPEATSSLLSEYKLDTLLVRSIRVETGTKGSAGVRLHFALGDASLSGVERVATGLLLTFRQESAPAAGTVVPAVTADSPDPGEYRVEVSDKLEITVFDHDDLNKIVDVRDDGTINYPLIGDVPVGGKTVAEIDAEITRTLGKDYLVDPQVSVSLRESQHQFLTIIGEVRNPGRYALRRNMRLIDLLAEAGGATREAGTQIMVTRRQEGNDPPLQITVDRERLLSQDNQAENISLRPGDIITVGEKEVFYVQGEVRSPATFLYASGMTIFRAVSMAGGFTQFANRKEVELLRSDAKGMHTRTIVNLKDIASGTTADVALRPDDIIIVPKRLF